MIAIAPFKYIERLAEPLSRSALRTAYPTDWRTTHSHVVWANGHIVCPRGHDEAMPTLPDCCIPMLERGNDKTDIPHIRIYDLHSAPRRVTN